MPTMEKAKSAKRILAIKIIRRVDDCPDTSHLGEYSNRATSEFSIDRSHSEDCASQKQETRDAKEKLERIGAYLDGLRIEAGLPGTEQSSEWEELDEATDTVDALAEEMTECDCNGGDMARNEYQFFNPSSNYVTKEDKPADGLTPEEVCKYTRQDYSRMESLNRGQWWYIGISAEAEVLTNAGSMSTVQRITSGGLYGIESDSDRPYLESVKHEELDSLKTELSAIGFSARAISKAFQSIEEVSR
jgi:hypothetical protein